VSTETATEIPLEGNRPPGMPASTLRLAVPAGGLTDGHVLLREISVGDVDDILPAFTDPELREARNLPRFSRDEMLASLPHMPALAASGRLMPTRRRGHADDGDRRRRHAPPPGRRAFDRRARVLAAPARARPRLRNAHRAALAEHSFALGIERVAAYVNVGNRDSERVLERAGFTREGVVRSLPKPDGRRVDKTLFSLLPGEL